jgi:hypothetical protein
MLVDTASANDAVEANEAEVAFTTLLAVTLNVEPSPLVNVVVALLIEAVVNNEPVFTEVPAFKANEAVVANEADVALLAYDADVEFNAYDALLAFIANELVVDTKAYEDDVDVLLYEALVACEAETAREELKAKSA